MANKNISNYGKETRLKKGDSRTKKISAMGGAANKQRYREIMAADTIADYLYAKRGIKVNDDFKSEEAILKIIGTVINLPLSEILFIKTEAEKNDSSIPGIMASAANVRWENYKNGKQDDIQDYMRRLFGNPTQNISAHFTGDAPRGFNDEE